MKSYARMLMAIAAGLVVFGCADDGPHDGRDEALTGLDLARAGLQQAHDGMIRFEGGDDRGLTFMDEGLQMMAEGLDGIEDAFGDMATIYMAGGHPVYGMGENSRCGTVEAVMGPMRYAWARMDGALGGLTDTDLANDAGACTQFHAGHVAMAECLGHAVDVLECLEE